MNRATYQAMYYIKESLELWLNELYEVEDSNDFIYGEKTAYVECLELLQKLQGAAAIGLDYCIEERYPLLSKK